MEGTVMYGVYAAFYEQIMEGSYGLEDILQRIDVMYAADRLTEQERMELYQFARENAKALYDASAEISKLWAAIREIRARLGALEGGGAEEPAEPAGEWPEFAQPTGAHDAYFNGDKITYNGKRYVCQMDGCVWPPDVYPDAWELQEESDNSEEQGGEESGLEPASPAGDGTGDEVQP